MQRSAFSTLKLATTFSIRVSGGYERKWRGSNDPLQWKAWARAMFAGRPVAAQFDGAERAACVALWMLHIVVAMRIVLPAAGGLTLPVGRPKLAYGTLRHQNAGCSRARHVPRSLQVPDEPGFDDLKLDEGLYKELGLDEDELEAQKTYEPDDIGAAHIALHCQAALDTIWLRRVTKPDPRVLVVYLCRS